jgi:hypothetical protein
VVDEQTPCDPTRSAARSIDGPMKKLSGHSGCAGLHLEHFADKKKMLLSLLAASGYIVPSAFVRTEIIRKED